MSRTLNTAKLLKQCKAIQRLAAEQQANPEPLPQLTEEAPQMSLTAAELEQYLTAFQSAARAANQRYEEAIALESLPNEAIQDYLHQLEFAPSELPDAEQVVRRLTELRIQRRVAKKELEVTRIWRDWAEENKVAINKLDRVIGDMRKVLNRQPTDLYFYKTDEIKPKGTFLQREE